MRVIATWSFVEFHRTRMLTSMLHADFTVVATMLTAINSSHAKQLALEAGINKSLVEADAKFFRAVWKTAIKPVETHRNRYAHWMWAYSEDLPESLILVPPDDAATWAASKYPTNESTAPPRKEHLKPILHHDWEEKALVYEKAEMEEHVRMADRATQLAIGLVTVIRSREEEIRVGRGIFREHLPYLPEVRARYPDLPLA